ncbi:MAG: TetR/AcrR family transcriptional regulator [Armatimonadetes bacterium]|nr:TetR/AcrR family transcriptional regulator [Armatimonadota bacterium]
MAEDVELQPRNSWKERRKQQLREELITVALEQFEERGCDATPVDEIAARAGIAKGTFYLYFKTKADIVQAALESAIGDLEQRVSRAVEESPEDARITLKSAIRARLGFFQERPGMISLLMDERGLDGHDLSPEAIEELRERYGAATQSVCERIIRKGMLQTYYREVDARVAACALLGMIAALVDDALRSGSSIADVADVAMEMFEKGVKRA